MNETKLHVLLQIEILRDLSREDLRKLNQRIRMRSFNPGHVFFAPSDPGEVLFFLIEGRAQLYGLSQGGKKLVITMLEPGAFFGEASILGRRFHNTFAEAIESCRVCTMDYADVKDLLLNKPEVALRLISTMFRRLCELEDKLQELIFKNTPGRLARLLLDLSLQRNGRARIMGYTHQDLSEVLGTYRETVTGILNDFRPQGWIGIGRKRIEILDGEALAAVAGKVPANKTALTAQTFETVVGRQGNQRSTA